MFAHSTKRCAVWERPIAISWHLCERAADRLDFDRNGEEAVTARAVARRKLACNRVASLPKNTAVFLLRYIVFIPCNTASDTLFHTSYFTWMTGENSVVFSLLESVIVY
jgi:hypothetical protein